jgi:16S rRNA G1207 methylase RsmC
MVFDRARFDSLRDNTSKARAISAFNLFQTPEAIADRMAALLLPSLSAGCTVLEPSAGLGRIYSALRRAGHAGPVVLAENSPDCCRELYTLTDGDNVTLKQGDFLEMNITADAVIMNPPFKMGRDIKHILHAFNCLAPGGLLVSLCYNGVKQNKKLKPLADSWEVLPAGSFKEEGARAEIVILTMKKNI